MPRISRSPNPRMALMSSKSAPAGPESSGGSRSLIVRRRVLVLLLLAATLLLVSLSPASSWLLEHAPDALLQWETRWIPRDPRPHLVIGERLLARGQTRPALVHFEQAASRGSQDFRLAVAI